MFATTIALFVASACAIVIVLYVSLLAIRRKRIWNRILDWLDRDDDPLRRDDPYEP